MNPTTTGIALAGGLLLLLLLSLMVMYNRFVRQRVLIDEAWGQTDVELTRRHDLVPSLVETVQGYAAHEREVLEGVTRAREQAAAHTDDAPHSREKFEDALSGAVRTLMVRAEAYPDLRASSNFLDLQDELTNTEDRIAAARRFYNGNVRAYNTRVATFPSILVAALFRFAARDYFELKEPSARQAPRVDLQREPPSA